MQFIDLSAQYNHLKEGIDARIKRVLSHGKFIMGPEVSELEEKLSDYIGVKHTISCANGTDALQLALMALNIGPGDAVFCPSFTFFATAEVISLVGATPVFVDSDELTFNMCTDSLKAQIEKIIASDVVVPKAIIAVDLFGLPANYDAITDIASNNSLMLIEDAAQGFGGAIGNKKTGSFGDIATTSFFPAKPLGCYGDGGALFTNNDELAEVLRSLRVHGKGSDKYDNVRIGINSRLDTIQAAILLEKLAVFPEELKRRNHVADYYNQSLSESFLIPHVPSGYVSSWAQYTLKVRSAEEREHYMSQLEHAGIPTAIYYQKTMHRQIAFEKFSDSVYLPICETFEDTVFSLPMHPYLEVHEQDKVVELLKEVAL